MEAGDAEGLRTQLRVNTVARSWIGIVHILFSNYFCAAKVVKQGYFLYFPACFLGFVSICGAGEVNRLAIFFVTLQPETINPHSD